MFIIHVSICYIILNAVSAYGHSLPNKNDFFIEPEPYNAYKVGENPYEDAKELEVDHWRNVGLNILHEKLHKKLNTNKAKNVIFFMGDGMSVPTITAARIYQGQLKNTSGEAEKLFFETFPYTGVSKTYAVDKQVADSASTATAYMTGVKTNYMTCGVSAHVKLGDCKAAKIESNRPTSIVKWAQDAGKATGVITNTRITHASPSGAYAHIPNRNMECDADVATLYDPTVCDFDIASQMVTEEPGKNINVLMGGGRSKFLLKSKGEGSRLDKDLLEVWKKDKETKKAVYVTDHEGLDKVDTSNTDYLLGLFAPSHMSYNIDRPDAQPPLWKMTETAIKVLQKEKNGFFLFVEGGLIDIAHHSNLAHKSLDETVAFAKAIETAAKMTNEEDTLIVVTADHAHTLSVSGYPVRGNDILQFAGKSDRDNIPYTTLSYANGPGYRPEQSGQRPNRVNDDLRNPEYVYPGRVPLESETHGGDDVLVYARGPWAHLFSGSYEQNYIPIAEAYAARIGPAADVNSAVIRSSNYLIMLFCSFLIILFRGKLC